jgi:hypothetical protein
MSYYYWPEIKKHKNPNPMERFDIKDERYYVPNFSSELTLYDIVNLPFIDLSYGSLLDACSDQEYENTHCKNNIIIAKNGLEFHSQTFEDVKAVSPYIHSFFGLSANAIVELKNILGLHDGLNNHSYVRICPELIFSFSTELISELRNLSGEQLEILATNWQSAVLKHYESEESEKVVSFWFGWITSYDYSHYTIEYFKELIHNLHELIRSCDVKESIYISVDY